jgi:adenylate kinase family enzyme
VLEYKIANHYADWDDWVLPQKADEEDINIQIYYPLLILQRDLYSGTTTKKGVSLKKIKHIQFRKESFLPKLNKTEDYQFDVITEDYIQDYLKIVESEMEKVIKVFKRKRKEVLISIRKIVNEVRGLKKKPKSYREYLEF